MIAAVALVARLVLVLTFAIAGVGKLADRGRTREMLTTFGVPTRFVGGASILLPAAEITIAGLLLVPGTAAVGAVAALALLGLFTAAVAYNLARGRKPTCNCFGQLRSKPIGARTLIRNGALMAVAAVALGGVLAEPPLPREGLTGMQWLGVGLTLLAALVLVGAVVVAVKLVTSYGRVLVRLERLESSIAALGLDLDPGAAQPMVGLDPGSESPWFLTTRLDGTAASRDDLLATGLPTLLLFTSPHCGPCTELMPEVAHWQREHADSLVLLVASDGAPDEIRAELAGVEPERVVLDERRELYAAFQANGTPSAVLVTGDGRVASWVAAGRDPIADLIERATAPQPEPTLPLGTPVPEIVLEGLDGEETRLADVISGPTVALLWNPECGYCRAMRDDLRDWERSPADGDPSLLVISSGGADETAAEGFAGRVLLDPRFRAGEALAAGGTPMALMISADRTVASDVVAGADAVLALLRGRPVNTG